MKASSMVGGRKVQLEHNSLVIFGALKARDGRTTNFAFRDKNKNGKEKRREGKVGKWTVIPRDSLQDWNDESEEKHYGNLRMTRLSAPKSVCLYQDEGKD